MIFRKLNIWMAGSIICAGIIILPLFEIIHSIFLPTSENWDHIQNYLLKDYFFTTVTLVLGVLITTILMAGPLAWILTLYRIPGQKYLKYLLFLPMAIPPYIGTFTYSGLMSYTGGVQQFIRSFYETAPKLYWMEIRGMGGAIFCFSLFLFPYIYLPCKAFLEKNGAQFIESARLLGDSEWRMFWRLGLPLLKVPIIAGATIIALDIFNDYAVASYLGVNTFSLAILKAWQNYSDVSSALRLSAYLLGLTLIVALLFRNYVKSKGAAFTSKSRPIIPKKMSPLFGFCASTFVYAVFSLTFVIPIGQMLYWTWHSWAHIRHAGLTQMAFNTFSLAFVSSLLIIVLAILITNYQRLFPSALASIIGKASNVGYTVPGAVIAICILAFFIDIYPPMTQSIGMLLFAYVLRYFMIGYKNVSSGFEKTGLSFHESSLMLGKNRFTTLWRVDLPLLKFSLISGFFLTFVDIAKELSMVLILRPFNFFTLSTKVFEYAHDEMIPESSPASLLIILISLVPVIFFIWMEQREEKKHVSRN